MILKPTWGAHGPVQTMAGLFALGRAYLNFHRSNKQSDANLSHQLVKAHLPKGLPVYNPRCYQQVLGILT